jgi:L-threonylcarbamoyladenylate synthase
LTSGSPRERLYPWEQGSLAYFGLRGNRGTPLAEVAEQGDVEDPREQAIAALRAGNLAVLPTDTVYGLCADAFNPAATQRLFGAKRRSRDVPLTVLVRNPRQVTGLVADVPEAADRLMASYWPGPVTVVLPAVDGLTWDLGDTRGTVALRMPADDLVLGVVGEVGPLACTGANRHSEPLPTTLDDARSQLGAVVAVYVDGGHREGPLSTVVDATTPEIAVLREGAVPAEHIVQVATGAVGWGERPGAAEGSR